MADRYRLPEVLGGGECVLLGPDLVNGRPTGFSRVAIPGPDGAHIRIQLDFSLLEPIPPPLPEEPPPGYYLVTGTGWRSFVAEHEKGYGWHVARHTDGFMWDEMCNRWPDAAYLRLTANPFAEPVTLPWIHPFDDGKPVQVSRSSASNRAAYVEGWGHLTTDEARAMARALWRTTVADQVESSQP